MIDLHSHTTESDGTLSPADLVGAARSAGVKILAITDHDTFAGYDQASVLQTDIEILCGIELSTKLHGFSTHLLGYFLSAAPTPKFRDWIIELQEGRRDRNVRLAAKLQSLGLDVTLEEVYTKGKSMAGRPHFAQILVEKGYSKTLQGAFDDYLDESAKGYVDRKEPQFADAVARIQAGGGMASLAHPIRLKESIDALMPEVLDVGLDALEAYHSDHSPELTARYLELADQYGMKVTGGSDFHGANKPEIELGTGRAGNLRIPKDILDRLR